MNDRDRLDRVLRSMPAGLIEVDRDWRITTMNAQAERVLSRSAPSLLGRVFWEAFPGTVGTLWEDHYREAVTTGAEVAFDAYYAEPLNTWLEVRAHPTEEGLSLYFLDLRARDVGVTAGRTVERLRLLAELSEALASTLDLDEAMRRLSELVVPALADYCVVTIVEDGALRDVAWMHRNPAQLPDLTAYVQVQLERMTRAAPIWQVLDTGDALVAPVLRPEVLERVFPDPEPRALLAALEATSGTAVPLLARGRAVGVLGLWCTGDRPPHTPEEVETAVELGRRAGLAVDNALLYSGQRRIAETLQRSLLGELPALPGLELATRYLPAASDAQVGGDWYDAFPDRDGGVHLVIGDVGGHDRFAAGVMGQLRNLLRGTAYTQCVPPSKVLSTLDRALADLAVDGLATAVLARLSVSADGTLVHWSNAGHPPPLLLHPSGRAELLTTAPELLLGLDPEADRSDAVVPLLPGARLLLYTDGPVERRGSSLDDGFAWLLSVAERLAALPIEAWCDGLLEGVAGHEDDIALLAVTLSP